jgi:hypothetical protein
MAPNRTGLTAHVVKYVNPLIWSAPAERSGDGALGFGRTSYLKAVSRCACHRTPN